MIPRGSLRPAMPATRSAIPSAPTRRRMPRRPTSAPTRRSWPSTSESCRSFTRTTFAPWVSTICLSRRSRESHIASFGSVTGGRVSRRVRRRRWPISCATSVHFTTRSPSPVPRIAHWIAGNWPCGTTARSLSVPTSLPFGSMTLRCWISLRYGMSPRNVPPYATMRSMSPQADAGLRVRALADQAVAAALDADWPRAVELNTKILEATADDIEGRHRLGRAFRDLGRLDEAKAAFAEVLKAEPYNSIAIRGSQRVTALLEHKAKAVTTNTKTQPRLFVEDMGKTGILRLLN